VQHVSGFVNGTGSSGGGKCFLVKSLSFVRGRERSVALVLALLGALAVLPAVPASAAPLAPVYVATLGNPGCTPGAADCGQALMYSSGGDVDEAGNIYIADTGNSQVASFTQ
jgi:hypothetical protein